MISSQVFFSISNLFLEVVQNKQIALIRHEFRVLPYLHSKEPNPKMHRYDMPETIFVCYRSLLESTDVSN